MCQYRAPHSSIPHASTGHRIGRTFSLLSWLTDSSPRTLQPCWHQHSLSQYRTSRSTCVAP
eukprot:1953256-Rhodomonas_salina.3